MKNQMDKDLEKELSGFIGNLDKERERQTKRRAAYMKDPANAERLEHIREHLKMAELLYNARMNAKLTQKDVAKKMGVSQPLVARIERGNGNISIDTIFRYVSACGKKVAVTLL